MFKYSPNNSLPITLSIFSSILQILSSILPITPPITLPTCRYASPRSLNTLTVCRYASQTLSLRVATLVHAHAIPPQSSTIVTIVTVYAVTQGGQSMLPRDQNLIENSNQYGLHYTCTTPRTPQLALLYTHRTQCVCARPHS